ncbi:hypothetical protein PINS_up001088 [Pythium insidiosum]|nr:hypothetical protein PINS_up001088 [Pythium insidiosum]
MLAFNSYGLQRSTGSNQHSTSSSSHGVTLPPLSLGSPPPRAPPLGPFPPPPRAARSLSKLDLLQRKEHPLYRTTTGFATRGNADVLATFRADEFSVIDTTMDDT